MIQWILMITNQQFEQLSTVSNHHSRFYRIVQRQSKVIIHKQCIISGGTYYINNAQQTMRHLQMPSRRNLISSRITNRIKQNNIKQSIIQYQQIDKHLRMIHRLLRIKRSYRLHTCNMFHLWCWNCWNTRNNRLWSAIIKTNINKYIQIDLVEIRELILNFSWLNDTSWVTYHVWQLFRVRR